MQPTGSSEETKRILAEAAAEERRRLRLEKETPAWIRRIADRNPEVQKIRAACDLIEAMVAKARLELKLPDDHASYAPFQKKRGRPCVAEHPLPRREAPGWDPSRYHREHAEKHRYYYQMGCEKCYMREYSYFNNHPERRPKGVQTAGADEFGNVKAAKPYSEGWDPIKYPFKA